MIRLAFVLALAAPAAGADPEYLKVSPRETVESAVKSAEALLKRGRHADALPVIEAALTAAPDNAALYKLRGDAAFYAKDYAAAVKDYSMSIHLRPANAVPFNNRGYASFKLGEHERALADYAAALMIDDSYALAYSNRGEVWHARKKYAEAVKDFAAAISLDGSSAEFYECGPPPSTSSTSRRRPTPTGPRPRRSREGVSARGGESPTLSERTPGRYHTPPSVRRRGVDMADVRPFRGFRYDLGRAGPLSDLVAPPYDVIDPALQQTLYDRSPFNAVRLELTRDEPGDTDHTNRYTRAAQALSGWQTDGVVRQDSLRNFYVVEQEFAVEGATHKRRGFLARVRLEPFGTGRIFPHEQTLSGPKEDRLKLVRATGMNSSPVFGLYPDAANEAFAPFEPLLYRNLPTEATDHLGVTSRLWAVTDEAILTAVSGAMTSKPIFIADGHHRYETGLRYLDERRETGQAGGDDGPAGFIMMLLVSMGDPGLVILPTHRLVSGFAGLTADRLTASLRPHFEVEAVGTGEVGRERRGRGSRWTAGRTCSASARRPTASG